MYFPDRQHCNPTRELNWRWQRANRLVRDHRYYRTGRDDSVTGSAVPYVRALQHATGDAQQEKLSRDFPDIRAAHLLGQHDSLRLVVESRLLADQCPQEIAELVPVTAEVIETYEALFFHVSDRLTAKCYIAKQAIGLTGASIESGCGLQAVVKWLGYYGGPLVLDLAIPVLVPEVASLFPCTDHDQNANSEATELSKKVKLIADLMTLPNADQRNTMKLLRLGAELANTTQLGGAAEESTLSSVFNRFVAEMFDDESPDASKHPDVTSDDSDSSPAKRGEREAA